MSKASLQTFVQGSRLPDDDKRLWDEIFPMLNDEQSAVFVDFVRGDEWRLAYLTENIRMKRKALVSADPGLLNEILKLEEDDLKSL